MKRRHNESLDEWASRRTSSRSEKNLVALLAVRDDIQAGLDAGYAIRTVWRYLHENGQVPCKYDAFLSFVHRHIRSARATKVKKSPPVPARNFSAAAPKPAMQKDSSDEIRGFTFNPVPRKEDLI